MPLTESDAVDRAVALRTMRDGESGRLDRIRAYLRNDQDMMTLPSGVPYEVQQLAKIARVNVLRFIVRAASQAMQVVGYRTPTSDGDLPGWETWQANRLDARQIGVHKAALAYGAGYVTVLPGDPVPVIRGASPRDLTAAYGDDDDWPVYALQRMRSGRWRLFDAEAVYTFEQTDPGDRLTLVAIDMHAAGVTPVVRFRDTEDLDDPVQGVVEPHTQMQDQLNVTTFGLLVAQHFGAFRQRAVIGWLAETEEQKLKASASRIWTFEDHPDDLRVQDLAETSLDGYLKSREATLQLLATVSQTPVHELLGQLVNLSAEALAAARDSHNRAVGEVQVVCGEAWEQALGLAGDLQGDPADPMAYVRWADLEARSLAQAADAFGKLVQMLGVPPQELWERVPGVTQQEVDRWKAAAAAGDALTMLADQLASDAATVPQPDPVGV